MSVETSQTSQLSAFVPPLPPSNPLKAGGGRGVDPKAKEGVALLRARGAWVRRYRFLVQALIRRPTIPGKNGSQRETLQGLVSATEAAAQQLHAAFGNEMAGSTWLQELTQATAAELVANKWVFDGAFSIDKEISQLVETAPSVSDFGALVSSDGGTTPSDEVRVALGLTILRASSPLLSLLLETPTGHAPQSLYVQLQDAVLDRALEKGLPEGARGLPVQVQVQALQAYVEAAMPLMGSAVSVVAAEFEGQTMCPTAAIVSRWTVGMEILEKMAEKQVLALAKRMAESVPEVTKTGGMQP